MDGYRYHLPQDNSTAGFQNVGHTIPVGSIENHARYEAHPNVPIFSAMQPHVPQYFPPQRAYNIPNIAFVPMNTNQNLRMPLLYQNAPGVMPWLGQFAQPSPFMAPPSAGIYLAHAPVDHLSTAAMYALPPGHGLQPMGYGPQPIWHSQQPMASGHVEHHQPLLQPLHHTVQQPTGYVQQPIGYVQQPTGYVQQPTGHIQQSPQQPTPHVQHPMATTPVQQSIQPPTGYVQQPTGHIQQSPQQSTPQVQHSMATMPVQQSIQPPTGYVQQATGRIEQSPQQPTAQVQHPMATMPVQQSIQPPTGYVQQATGHIEQSPQQSTPQVQHSMATMPVQQSIQPPTGYVQQPTGHIQQSPQQPTPQVQHPMATMSVHQSVQPPTGYVQQHTGHIQQSPQQPTPQVQQSLGHVQWHAGYNSPPAVYHTPVNPPIAAMPAPAFNFDLLNNLMHTQSNAAPALSSVMSTQPGAMPTLPIATPVLPSLIAAHPNAMHVLRDTTPALSNALSDRSSALSGELSAPSDQASGMPIQPCALSGPFSNPMSARAPGLHHSGQAYPSPILSSSSHAKTKALRYPSTTSATRSMSQGSTRESGPYARTKRSKSSNNTDTVISPQRKIELATVGEATKVGFAIKRLTEGPAMSKDIRACSCLTEAIEASTKEELSTEDRKYLSDVAIQFWDGKKRRLKEKCFDEVPDPFKVDNGAIQQLQDTENLGDEIAAELDHTLRLLCADPVEGEPIEAFVHKYIFDLLEVLVFAGHLKTALGIQHTSSFSGTYHLPAVAYVCALIHFASWCKRKGKTGVEFSYAVCFPTYSQILWLLAGMWDHPVHGPRLRTLLVNKFFDACRRNGVNPLPTPPDATCQPTDLSYIHQNRHLKVLQTVIDFQLDIDIDANGSGELETPSTSIVPPTAQSNAGDHSRSGYYSLWVNDPSSSSTIGGH